MDRRDPEYKDVFVDIALLFIKSPLTPLFQRGGLNSNIKSSIRISWWIHYECHPWQLHPGDPCRDDGSTVSACITRQIEVPTKIISIFCDKKSVNYFWSSIKDA